MHNTAHSLFCYLFQLFKVFFFVGVPFWLFCLGYERPIFCYVFPWFFCRENFFVSGQVVYFVIADDGLYWKAKSESRRLHIQALVTQVSITFTRRVVTFDIWKQIMWEDHLLHRCNNSTKIYYCPEKVPKIVHEPPTERHSGKQKGATKCNEIY